MTMTNDELKALVANLAISQAQTEEQVNKTSKVVAETSKVVEATSKKVEEMTATLKSLGINVDGIGKTMGLDSEEFFYSSINENKILNNIKFDSIMPNIRAKKAGRQHEMDIFLENGNSVGIIEVKNRVKEKDLEQLQKIVDNFYFFHPLFKNHKIIPAIAGKIFPKHIQNKALKNGFVVIKQVGNHIEQRNPD